MGLAYILTPREEPSWRFTAGDFAARIRDRWPHARVGIGDLPGSPALLHALIPADPLSRELGIALAEGWVVILDPVTPAGAAEFALWYVGQLPGFDPPVHLITDDYQVSLELRPDTTAEDLLTFLAPIDVARPDPQTVGTRAAQIADHIHAGSHHRALVAAARMLPQRWATLGGLVLVAQLDLAVDAEPLLREALRLLALRAAVHELTESDTAAATLVAPAPVDDGIRVVLAEQPLCAQLARDAGIRLVHQSTEWTPLGWQPGNYTDRCYRAAWGCPDQRYWLDANEAARRRKILGRRYADAGVPRDGTRHTIRFDPVPPPWMVAV